MHVFMCVYVCMYVCTYVYVCLCVCVRMSALPPAHSYRRPPAAEQWLAPALCQQVPGNRRCRVSGPYDGRYRSVPSFLWPAS